MTSHGGNGCERRRPDALASGNLAIPLEMEEGTSRASQWRRLQAPAEEVKVQTEKADLVLLPA